MIQLIALNMKFRTDDASQQAVRMEQSFSPSLITSARRWPVPSIPDRKSVLVDASGLLLGDIPGYSTRLEMAVYRLPYAPDRANSLHRVHPRRRPGLTTLTSRVHFATAAHPGAAADAACTGGRAHAAAGRAGPALDVLQLRLQLPRAARTAGRRAPCPTRAWVISWRATATSATT